jgi:phenylalanyl-tRNA synthetase beta chain
MKVSLSWLQAYVAIEMDATRLADALTMTGLEVEAILDRYEYLEHGYVGRIIDISPHPNADTLSCCEVDLGSRKISVVCGAPNIEKNMLVPVVLSGTLLPFGTPVEKSVVRGIASDGMLCSEAELGLGSDQSGIMALNPSLPVGEKLTRALNLFDIVFEIGLTPNRPDCLSIMGIAREVAAIQKIKIKSPEIKLPRGQNNISDLTSVTILAPVLCPRYAAGLLADISVGPSPFWLQDKLMSVGLRPINNVVDITNFVMLEMGQPLHAFDFDRLAGHKIVVRAADKGEKFFTLDQKERQLSGYCGRYGWA